MTGLVVFAAAGLALAFMPKDRYAAPVILMTLILGAIGLIFGG